MIKYIWQTLQESGYQNVHFEEEKEYPSILQEVTFESENENKQVEVMVNLARRFSFLWDYSFDDEEKIMTAWEIDLVLHFLGSLDFRSGYNLYNYRMDYIEKEILDGMYGDKIRCIYRELNQREKELVLQELKKGRLGNRESFCKIMHEFFPKMLIYERGNEILLYIDMDEDRSLLEKTDLCRRLFLPLCVCVKYHFKYHIGLIGLDCTMHIDKIRII